MTHAKQYIVGGLAGVTLGLLVYAIAYVARTHMLGGWPINIALAATIAMCASRLYIGWRREADYLSRLNDREARRVEDAWWTLRDEEAQVAARLMRTSRSPRAAE